MSKGIQKWSEATIARLIKEGRGSGEGPNYVPWVGVHDVASLGRTHRAWSPTYERTIHLLSDVEWRTFILLEYSRKFPELYEGYPLDRKITLEISAALGIAHPCYPRTTIPMVMTVDFLGVDRRVGNARIEAFDCKRSEDMDSENAERTIEKLEITRAYFAGMNVPHHLVLHSQLHDQTVRNVEWIRSGILKHDEPEPYEGYFREKLEQMNNELTNGTFTCSLSEYCRAFDERHAMRAGEGSRLARMLLWEHRLKCNLSNIDVNKLSVSSLPGNLEHDSRRAA
ncbi:TnsA endonuclease N-terminal domain-containing protein [Paraburkholderia sp. J11-2]|uniref:TnsA endonuclease N-terminal domain-containing protein n=1 Tax=Paraburkholderia sp. J11-2 TaxID=2805431 RepID=UPI002AB736FB|nr:TnsA endonuclease C-terminal domain-containing protein [Paraburkholderia sp. J11-2]